MSVATAGPSDVAARATSTARRRSGWPGDGWIVLSLAGPATFLMFVFIIGPVIAVTALSMTDYQLGAASLRFVGLDNYAQLFGDRTFQQSLRNTLIYVGVVVPGAVLLGLGVALLIETGTQWRAFYRAVYFLPVMATLIAMAIVWEFMFHPSFGLVNLTLRLVGIQGMDWLQNRNSVLFTIAGIGVWQMLGFNMVLFMAGLTAIPRELYDAAAVDGVQDGWDRFWTVTWPMLAPVTLFVVVISAIRSFQVFDVVHAITKGGPNKASEVLLHTMYSEGFGFFRTGYAAAITVVFLLFVLVLALIKMRVLERRVHYS